MITEERKKECVKSLEGHEFKQCLKCGVELSNTEFFDNMFDPDAHVIRNDYCKICLRDRLGYRESDDLKNQNALKRELHINV